MFNAWNVSLCNVIIVCRYTNSALKIEKFKDCFGIGFGNVKRFRFQKHDNDIILVIATESQTDIPASLLYRLLLCFQVIKSMNVLYVYILPTYQQSHQRRVGRTQTGHRTQDSPLQHWLRESNNNWSITDASPSREQEQQPVVRPMNRVPIATWIESLGFPKPFLLKQGAFTTSVAIPDHF